MAERAIFISKTAAKRAAYRRCRDLGNTQEQADANSKAIPHYERGELKGYLGIWTAYGCGYPVLED